MFTVSTGVYTSIPPFATISMQYSQESSRHATQCKICIHLICKTIVRIRTRSHLFSAVPDVSKIPVYVNYSCVIAVVCVRILIDAEKLNSKCQVEITLQRIPCSPAHHKRSPLDSAQSIHTSEFQAHCKQKENHWLGHAMSHRPPAFNATRTHAGTRSQRSGMRQLGSA